MTALSLLALLAAAPAWADAPVPYFNRSFGTSQSTGAVNANFLDLTQRNRDNLVNSITDNACAAGQALTGATQKGGYIFGGTCTTVSTATASTAWTGAGYVVGSSVGITGAASTLISGLDGNTDKNWRIQIDGLIATAGSNSFIKIRPNSDSGANYQGIMNSDYSGATTRNAWSAGMYAGELLSNTAESIHSTFWVHSSTATSLKRCGHLLAGFSDTGGEQGETHGGGCWTNTTDNITSLNIIWANTSFTGTVSVYRD